MGALILPVAAGAMSFVVLDGLWLGLVMKDFYRGKLAAIGRIDDGGFAPNWPAALVVYVLLGLGLALFAAPRADSLATAAAYGALFGFTVYGVYDFTNFATLLHYPLELVFVDVAWGTTASALAAMAVWMAAR